MKSLKEKLIELCEKFIAIFAFIFPFTEISYYFGAKVFLSTESLVLKLFYLNYVAKLASFYEANVYLVFALMVGIFITCSRGTIRLTKFVRFNIIQAILLNIVCSCIGSIYAFLPIVLREWFYLYRPFHIIKGVASLHSQDKQTPYSSDVHYLCKCLRL